MKYKVGDKVKIKSLDWYNANKDFNDEVHTRATFVKEMSNYCGKEATIVNINNGCNLTIGGVRKLGYDLDIDKGYFGWTDDMFEENFNDMETKKIVLPDGWEIDRVENGEILLKESKKELPKTWEECYKQLGKGEYIRSSDSTIAELNDCSYAEADDRNIIPAGLGKPMLALMQLLVCRDVYRQGWKPSLGDVSIKYVIYNCCNKIEKGEGSRTNYILSFKLEEVRNKFLENFRDLIEEAKELI